MPSNPYRFGAPDFEALLPFTKAELQAFKNKKIYKVELSSSGLRTIYYLNEQGQVATGEQIWIKKKKEVLTHTTAYKYNENGLLTVRHATGKHYIFYDSLAYDDNGRIIHYSSYNQSLRGKKKYRTKEVGWNLQLLSSDENKVVLVDSLYNPAKHFTLDNNNQVLLIHSPNQTDSVSIEQSEALELTKKYWYKPREDSVFRVGKAITYKNNKIQTETLWDKVGSGNIVIYKKHYTYDSSNRLLRVEKKGRNQLSIFYTYNHLDLVMEHYTIKQDKMTLVRYRYEFS